MKKILLIAFLLIPFIGFSQTAKPIDGFLGIKFGSPRAVVLAAVKAKGGILDKGETNNESLMFTNVKLGHRVAVAFRISFVNNKAFEAEYIFATDVEAQIPGYYDDLVKDLTTIYGPGVPTKDYTSPYQEGDGNELLGLSAGKIDFHTLWDDSKTNNSMAAYIDPKMTVHLLYTDNALAKLYATKSQAKDSADY